MLGRKEKSQAVKKKVVWNEGKEVVKLNKNEVVRGRVKEKVWNIEKEMMSEEKEVLEGE